MNKTAQILVRTDVDLEIFREEIQPGNRPVLLKALVKHWDIVKAARESPRALADYLGRFDRGRLPNVIEAPPAAGGRLFYRDDLSGLNFTRYAAPIGATLDRILSLADLAEPPAVFIESMSAADFMPDFAAAHPMPLLDPMVGPRLWIGNRVTVQTHYDLVYNIACLVGGRRRFTLFPPDQLPNLYVGPLDFTPAGAPVSMVPLANPDLARYPRFAEALRHAQVFELEPGDAVYVPYGWWHHVESLTPFNVLVNYWWNPAPNVGSPNTVLLHAAMSLRDMPPDQRQVWKAIFDHLVFSDAEESLGHLPPEKRGLLGPPSASRMRKVREILAQIFAKPG